MTTPPIPLLLFSDVDGTLIDERYELRLTRAQLQRLTAAARLILVSSRTLEELDHQLDTWGIAADCIAENGALIATRDAALASALGASPDPDASSWWTRSLAASRDQTMAATRRALEQAGFSATPADALPLATFAALSGYGMDDALRARSRRHAVLLMPLPLAALEALQRAGLQATFGGRWVTVLSGANKGVAVTHYLEAWTAMQGGSSGNRSSAVHAVGVGDAPNDLPMLNVVHTRFAMAAASGAVDPTLEAVPSLHVLPPNGTAAWEIILQHCEEAVLHV